MSKFYAPIKKAKDWQNFLADPDKHWKDKCSALTLAYCWQDANDFPKCVKNVINTSEFDVLKNIRILFAFPEYKVPLKGGGRASQNDIYIIAKGSRELISIAVEGKVIEQFGDLVIDWLKKKDDKTNKPERIDYLKSVIGLQNHNIDNIRYQLIHRTASTLICANEINAKNAMMLVHSFSEIDKWYEDYETFVSMYGFTAQKNKVVGPAKIGNIDLYFSWVHGEQKYINFIEPKDNS